MINPLNRQELSALAAFTAQIHKVIHNSFSEMQLYLLTWDLKWDKLKKSCMPFSWKMAMRAFERSSALDYLIWCYGTGSEIHSPSLWHLDPLVSVWGPGVHCYWTLSWQEDKEGPSRWTPWIPYLSGLQLFISLSSFHPKSVSLTIDWVHRSLAK